MEPIPYERRRRRGLWWLWPLLALLLLVVLITLLVRACDDGDGGNPGGGTAAAQTNEAGEGETVELDELLGAAGGGSLAEWEGRQVDVADAEVLTVVPDAGFWIGSGDVQRVFVEVEDETGLDELGLEEGDTVSFVGTVEPNVEAETYGLTGDDATLFRAQGAHIRVQAADVEKG